MLSTSNKVQMISWWSELPNIFLYLLLIKKKNALYFKVATTTTTKELPNIHIWWKQKFPVSFQKGIFYPVCK